MAILCASISLPYSSMPSGLAWDQFEIFFVVIIFLCMHCGVNDFFLLNAVSDLKIQYVVIQIGKNRLCTNLDHLQKPAMWILLYTDLGSQVLN